MSKAQDSLQIFSHKITIGDYNLQYVKVGHGPRPVFAFVGLMGSLEASFTKLISKIDKIDPEKYTFYAYDHAGYSRSGSPLRKLTDINFQLDVEIAAKFMKEMGHLKYDILGHSAGGQIALLFTIRHPDLVNKLLLWGAWDRFGKEDLIYYEFHRDMENVRGHPFVARLLKELGDETATEHWHAWHDMILREYNNDKDPVTWNKRFENFSCPTLVIWGSQDGLIPRRRAEDIHKKIKNSRFVVVEGSPHDTHLVCADEFYSIMDDFLQESNPVEL